MKISEILDIADELRNIQKHIDKGHKGKEIENEFRDKYNNYRGCVPKMESKLRSIVEMLPEIKNIIKKYHTLQEMDALTDTESSVEKCKELLNKLNAWENT